MQYINLIGYFSMVLRSGTTGLAKGVVIELGNVMNLRNWWVDYFCVKPEDRCMLFSSLSFIMSIRQWLPPLTTGASVIIPKSAFEFDSAIVQCKVNKLVCTPSALAALDFDKIKHLDAIQVAGEQPQKQVMDMWMKKVNQVHIGLGPTELCAHALCGAYDGQTLCIGLPAANVRAYVVNKSGYQCPINCIGELWVAGSNVAKGYLHRQAENSKHFSTDGFAGDGSRLYKSGDLCRRLSDGRIQFIGRRDKQIKMNGYRIEIGDIQSALGHKVQNSCVLMKNGQLILFVMPKIDVSEIKASLQKKLPTVSRVETDIYSYLGSELNNYPPPISKYMIPSRIVSFEDFPLDKNRKINTAALIEQSSLEDDGKVIQEEHIESYIEKVIKTVWSEVLCIQLEELKRRENFFAAGGTSLTAVILSRKLSKELCTDVSVQDVFRFQTIASFADHIKSRTTMPIHVMPDPLTYLAGGNRALNRYTFALLQILGLSLMTILVAFPLLATTLISIRSMIWFGAPGVFLFPFFVSVGCLVRDTESRMDHHLGILVLIIFSAM